ncbi:MAG: hypothetical protein ACTSYG_02890 [Candidatus Heimdallarchaeota archaeon]|nr:MAG: hypothetical protein DRO91_06610 [Candidatus Heimdallarchaeota archaeon]RLI71705.1 MAG: hypothetical protein DRP02_03935 [Candidatus Gerdarchaeota archaeon]
MKETTEEQQEFRISPKIILIFLASIIVSSIAILFATLYLFQSATASSIAVFIVVLIFFFILPLILLVIFYIKKIRPLSPKKEEKKEITLLRVEKKEQ